MQPFLTSPCQGRKKFIKLERRENPPDKGDLGGCI